MKTAIVAESPADDRVAGTLAAAVLQRELTFIDTPFRARGWPAVRDILPTVIKHLYYHSDAELLLVLADGDLSSVHWPEHTPQTAGDCRFCALTQIAGDTLNRSRPVAGRNQLRVAAGVAVPCLEAWLCCGRHNHVTEAVWIAARREGRLAFPARALKRLVYGTERPSLEEEVAVASNEATRLISDLNSLELFFPNSFGAFARELRRIIGGA